MAVQLAKRQRAVEDLRQNVLYQKIVSAGLTDHILPGLDYNNPSISTRADSRIFPPFPIRNA